RQNTTTTPESVVISPQSSLPSHNRCRSARKIVPKMGTLLLRSNIESSYINLVPILGTYLICQKGYTDGKRC
ncbi:MAG: hypothetical protein ACREDP_23515, partial [Bradyrhizobium sp.]